MATKRRKPTRSTTLRGLERRVKRLETELAAARVRHAGQLERVRRAADRRLAAMVREIATLRHHEARAEALTRLLAAHGVAATTGGNRDGEDPRLPG